MLGEFITRGLVLVLGYAYPAFECFKTMEKNKIEKAELQFWCQYWVILAVLTILERIGDIFISWVPMYGETKLAIIIYLWFPKTKGTGYVYEKLLRPCVAKAMQEPGLDRSFQELRARSWEVAIYYWQNCTELSQTKFFQIFDYLTGQSRKLTNTNNKKTENHYPNSAADRRKQPSDQRQLQLTPAVSLGITNPAAQSPKSVIVQAHLHSQTEIIHTHEELEPVSTSGSSSGSTHESDNGLDYSPDAVHLRLRRSKAIH
ncbi:hypothetical protein CsSME_00037840 [Camellia sinensis var. sinensis]